MIKFFKYYFDFSHEEKYRFGVGEPVKVSKKERMIWIITCYIWMLLSFLILLIPLSFFTRLFLFIGAFIFPIGEITVFDFRIIKVFCLYLFSKSKNVNKNIIYRGYMMSDVFFDSVVKCFMDYKDKNIMILRDYLHFYIFWFLNHKKVSINIRPRRVIIKVDKHKDIIKNNKSSFEELLKKMRDLISYYDIFKNDINNNYQ